MFAVSRPMAAMTVVAWFACDSDQVAHGAGRVNTTASEPAGLDGLADPRRRLPDRAVGGRSASSRVRWTSHELSQWRCPPRQGPVRSRSARGVLHRSGHTSTGRWQQVGAHPKSCRSWWWPRPSPRSSTRRPGGRRGLLLEALAGWHGLHDAGERDPLAADSIPSIARSIC